MKRLQGIAQTMCRRGKGQKSIETDRELEFARRTAAEMKSNRLSSQRRYMPGLDGLRALAVIAVIVYHLNPDWLPGGLLGVGVFFTLSGYLITDILVSQWDTYHSFKMKDFWLRRARRLLPAMLTVVAVIVLCSLLFDPSRLTALRGDVPAALVYMSNWWFIFHQVSYFESFGPPSPLGHLWSLAVEEQFYILWPLLLALGLKFMPKRIVLAGWVTCLALISALLMAVIYVPGSDPSRVYYGTDTRGFALLIGAALALVWPSGKLKEQASAKARMLLDSIGAISLLLLCHWAWASNEYDPSLYRGGLLGIALVTAIVVAALAHPVSHLGRLLGIKPLRWIGARSYGLYLWHFPVITLTTPQVDTDGVHVTRIILQLLATVLLASLSFKYIEEPIRHGGFRHWITEIRSAVRRQARWRWMPTTTAAVLFAGILMGTVHLYVASPDATIQAASSDEKPVAKAKAMPPLHGTVSVASKEPQATKLQGSGGSKAQTPAPSQAQTPKNTVVQVGTTDDVTKPSEPSDKPKEDTPMTGDGSSVTAIGDSVMLDVQSYLQESFPGAVVDGRIGRQMAEAPAVLEQLRQNGQLGKTVIIELGTNGAFTKDQLANLLASLKDTKRIILVNTRVPRPWESIVNKHLAEAASQDPRITMIDWYAASSGKNSYFEHDGVHLKPKGAKAYASLLAQVLTKQS
ncbi:peptidoglycan/LPS O-acetylase OafA/YrhL/lysophospholipase L1-like esterase [Paenibacillus sp. 1182]|uniref:acyltransferase family protein n=1 Tax=Paenibacillus sp. 1182 TaxID=2806565 RepID=UPI001AE8E07C|nr:acyltransferase family protein [Paenibacillus sp. 1182]MBP1307697.1 peptidoglycan/LPS O-acetylase OafA/YrhL/lysophospholipase L1-like esterase [Paenibacillus sp. 1182]